MSTTLGALTALIQDAVDDDSTEGKAEIHRAMNQSYREIAIMHFWQALVSNITLSSSVLPGDMERPFAIQPADTDYLYFPISFQDQYTNRRLYAWFTNLQSATPLLTGADLTVTANGTTVTSAGSDFTAATYAGEYIRIGVSGGIYKIDSVTDANNLVLVNGYRGDSATNQYFEIRPEGTKKINRTDYDGQDTGSTSDQFWYLRRPLPLYNDYDSIPLPGTCEALRIMTLQRVLEGDKYDNDALKQQDNFRNAIGEMKALEPTVGREPRARDQFGNQMMFGRRRSAERFSAANRRVLGI